MHKSQAFAAFRTELVAALQLDLTSELLPKYNSEIEDIRRSTEEIRGTRGEALADHHKRSRLMDLKVRQQDFIEGLNKEMRDGLEQRVKDYGGAITTSNDGKRDVLEAKFSDGSTARMPKSLWIDYSQFQRV